MTAAVCIEGLSLHYPSGIAALADVSLRVRRGEIFGLLGLNGAGKSSLIKAIATLLRPTAGQVLIFGLDAHRQAPAIKRRIGVVPQENNLDTYLDLRRNLLFHCRYAGIPHRTAAQRTERWLSLLGLADKADESVLHLSGGSRRKAMLAKAFVTGPELLLLDEPSAGLDPEVRELLWAQVRIFRDAGGTVFLSTHHLEEAEALCDRVGILQHGRLVSLVTAQDSDAFTPGSVVAAFRATTAAIGTATPA